MIFLGKSDIPLRSLNKLFEGPRIVIDKSLLEKAKDSANQTTDNNI